MAFVRLIIQTAFDISSVRSAGWRCQWLVTAEDSGSPTAGDVLWKTTHYASWFVGTRAMGQRSEVSVDIVGWHCSRSYTRNKTNLRTYIHLSLLHYLWDNLALCTIPYPLKISNHITSQHKLSNNFETVLQYQFLQLTKINLKTKNRIGHHRDILLMVQEW